MQIIEKLEKAQEQTWWLPSSATIYEGDDHCYYKHNGKYFIVRFTPRDNDINPLLLQIMQVVGSDPVRFIYMPHRHNESIRQAFLHAGFTKNNRYEARAIHVDDYNKQPPAHIQTIMVQTFEEMKQVGGEIKKLEAQLAERETKVDAFMAGLPNIPDDDVPAGGKENNQVIRTWGDKPSHDFATRDHVELLRRVRRVIRPESVVFFSTNFRKFQLDDEVEALYEVEAIRESVPEDFARSPKIHQSWRLVSRRRR